MSVTVVRTMKIKRIPITKARNDFFEIVRRGYLKKEVVLVEKVGGVENLIKEGDEKK